MDSQDREQRRKAFHRNRSARENAEAEAARAAEENRIRAAAYDWAVGRGASPSTAGLLSTLTDFIPLLGDAAGFEDAYQSYRGGRYGQAAVEGLLGALGVIPGAGDAAAAIGKTVAPAIFVGLRGARGLGEDALRNMQRAAELEMAGVDPTDIWRETGVSRAPDGFQRLEIDDRPSQFRLETPEAVADYEWETRGLLDRDGPRPDDWVPKHAGVRLGDLIEHPRLFEAYPYFQGFDVRFTADLPENTYGSFEPGQRPYRVMAEESFERGEMPSAFGLGQVSLPWNWFEQTPEARRSALFHELQHAVQGWERHAEGANVAGSAPLQYDPLSLRLSRQIATQYADAMVPALREAGMSERDAVALVDDVWERSVQKTAPEHAVDLGDLHHRVRQRLSKTRPDLVKTNPDMPYAEPGLPPSVDAVFKEYWPLAKEIRPQSPFRAYEATFGEVEARNAGLRSIPGTDYFERPPWDTEYVSRKPQQKTVDGRVENDYPPDVTIFGTDAFGAWMEPFPRDMMSVWRGNRRER